MSRRVPDPANEYITASGAVYVARGKVAALLALLTSAGGEVAGADLSRAVFLSEKKTVGSFFAAAVEMGIVAMRRVGSRTVWWRVFPHGPAADSAGAGAPPRVRVAFAGKVPRCTTAGAYNAWREAASHAKPLRELGFCEDCTEAHQVEMKLQERCENPMVWFERGVAGIGPRARRQSSSGGESDA